MPGDGPPTEPLTVIYEGISHDVEPDGRLTFGRGADCTIRVGLQSDGSYDLRVSRDAGYFEALGPTWHVWATGNSLDVVDDLGGMVPVLRGKGAAVNRAYVLVFVIGRQRHRLEVRYPQQALPSAMSVPYTYDGEWTERPPDPKPSKREKVVYVAKLAPLLDGGAGPRSLSSTAAFLRSLGESDPEYTDSAVRNLWEEWVGKCVDAGFIGLTRKTGLESQSADRAMFLELRRRGLLIHEDLKLLPGDHDP